MLLNSTVSVGESCSLLNAATSSSIRDLTAWGSARDSYYRDTLHGLTDVFCVTVSRWTRVAVSFCCLRQGLRICAFAISIISFRISKAMATVTILTIFFCVPPRFQSCIAKAQSRRALKIFFSLVLLTLPTYPAFNWLAAYGERFVVMLFRFNQNSPPIVSLLLSPFLTFNETLFH